MPQCEVCDGCYYQWKVALHSLSRNISVEVSRAYNISLTPNQPGIVSRLFQSSFVYFLLTEFEVALGYKTKGKKLDDAISKIFIIYYCVSDGFGSDFRS